MVQFSLTSDDDFLLQYFSPQYYENCSLVFVISIIISLMTMSMLAVAVISQFIEGNNAKKMIITIETVCIVQFAYFSLISIGPLNPMFVAMAEGLKYTSGYDMNLSDIKTKAKSLMAMNIQSANMEGNVNISVVIPLVFLVVGLVFWIM